MGRLLAVLTTLCLIIAQAARAEERVALVIGNGAYTHIGPLANPTRDADLIAAALRDRGFDVALHKDLTEDGMGNALDSFAYRADTADVAAIYFAGHGLQRRGENFLMPVDAELRSESAISREGISLDDVLDIVRDVPISLVFVDACRNNPFANQLRRDDRGNLGGLAVVRPPGDMLIAYATLPNTTASDGVGANSPFARALAGHMATPNVEVSVMMKRVTRQVYQETGQEQRPQQLSQMATEFYFARDETPLPATAPVLEVADYKALLAVYPPRVTAGMEVSVVADIPVDCVPAFFNLAPDRTLTPIPRRFFKLVPFENGQIRYEISPGSRYGLVIEEEDALGVNQIGYLCEPPGMDRQDQRAALLQAVLAEIDAGRDEGRVSAGGFADVAYQVRPFEIQ